MGSSATADAYLTDIYRFSVITAILKNKSYLRAVAYVLILPTCDINFEFILNFNAS